MSQLTTARNRRRVQRDDTLPQTSTLIEPQPVATTATLIPGTNVPFYDISGPTIDGNNISFNGSSKMGKPDGLFGVINGKLVKLVVVGDPTPRGDVFTVIDYGVIGGSLVAFMASSGVRSEISGIYQVSTGGTVSKVADTSTQLPRLREQFTSFSFAGGIGSTPVTDGTNVVFTGTGFRTCGVFSGSPGNLTDIATSNTRAPGTSVNFTGFGGVDIDGSSIVFFGETADEDSKAGLYASIDGVLSLLASTKTEAPDGTGRFNGFGAPVISGDRLAFRATTEHGAGIFAGSLSGGPLTTIANLDTRSPSGVPFHVFPEDPAISGGIVAFSAVPENPGVFTSSNGVISKVFDVTQRVGGKEVLNIDFFPFELSGKTIAFWIELTDLSLGVYKLTIQ